MRSLDCARKVGTLTTENANTTLVLHTALALVTYEIDPGAGEHGERQYHIDF